MQGQSVTIGTDPSLVDRLFSHPAMNSGVLNVASPGSTNCAAIVDEPSMKMLVGPRMLGIGVLVGFVA